MENLEKREPSSNGNGANTLLWFAAGLAAGAAVGLLFAPQPGEETRRKLSDLAADGRNSLTDRGRNLVDS